MRRRRERLRIAGGAIKPLRAEVWVSLAVRYQTPCGSQESLLAELSALACLESVWHVIMSAIFKGSISVRCHQTLRQFFREVNWPLLGWSSQVLRQLFSRQRQLCSQRALDNWVSWPARPRTSPTLASARPSSFASASASVSLIDGRGWFALPLAALACWVALRAKCTQEMLGANLQLRMRQRLLQRVRASLLEEKENDGSRTALVDERCGGNCKM